MLVLPKKLLINSKVQLRRYIAFFIALPMLLFLSGVSAKNSVELLKLPIEYESVEENILIVSPDQNKIYSVGAEPVLGLEPKAIILKYVDDIHVDPTPGGVVNYNIKANNSIQIDPDTLQVNGLLSFCNPVEFEYVIRYEKTTTVIYLDDFYIIPGKREIPADWLPPKLGIDTPRGMVSIEGIDEDGDCVRDDIEHYIASQYSRKVDKHKRKYLFEYAKWMGMYLNDINITVSSARSISIQLYRSAECVRRIHGDTAKTQDLLDNLFANYLNTWPRSYRYLNSDKRLNGWKTRESIYVSCP